MPKAKDIIAQKAERARKRKAEGKPPAYDIMKDPRYAAAAKNLLENGGIPGPTGGRPNKYHPAIVQAAWDLLEDAKSPENKKKGICYTFAELCEALGISENTGEKWKEEFPPFLRVALAHKTRLKIFYEKTLKLSAAGKSKGNSSSIALGLTNLDPVNYKRRQYIEQKVEQKVEEVTDLDVNGMSAKEKREHLAMMQRVRDEENRSAAARNDAATGKVKE